MGDKFTVTTRNSWGSRIANSFTGMLFGFLLIPLAIWGLWWNEGLPDLSVYAKESVEIDSKSVDAAFDGKFVSFTGRITSEETVGDPPYFEPGPYISVSRSTEMYAWVEQTETSEDVDTVGGGSTTTTTYTYRKEWTSNPADSGSFKYPDGHENPQPQFASETFRVGTAMIEAYLVSPNSGVSIPTGNEITPKPGDLPAGFVKAGKYIYTRDGAQSSPQVGDERFSYTALKSGTTVTAIGSVNNGEFAPFLYDNEHEFFRVFVGTRADAIATLHTEYLMFLWIIRIVGIFGIFIGLQLLVAPIGRILSVVGIIGAAYEGITGFFNFFLALMLGITTIIISKIFHNIYVLAAIILIIIGVVVWYMRGRSNKMVTAGAGATPSTGDTDASPPKMT